MSDLVKPDLVVHNKTALFLINSSNWEHDTFNQKVAETAVALEQAATKEERKEILDNSLGLTITAYRDIARTLSRFCCFLCLSYKPEKLFKLDLQGLTFHNDEEAFSYWVREFLTKMDCEAPLISKVKHYLLANDDMAMIERLTFEKAWVVSKYQRLLAEHNFTIPESVLIWAENKDVTTSEVTEDLDLTKTLLEKTKHYRETEGSDPTPEILKSWERLHAQERVRISTSYKKTKPPDDPIYNKLHEVLGGLMKGDAQAISRFYHTLFEDLLPSEYDVSELIYEFMHDVQQNRCSISGKELGKYEPMQIHHIQSRGSMTDRRFGNLIPVAQSVHQEINDYGINTVMEKHSVTAEFIIAQGFRVTPEYIQWLESRPIYQE